LRINRDLFEASAWEGKEPPEGTSVEEDLLGGFYSTRKPYLTGMGSSAWGGFVNDFNVMHF
jgi:hypothetical protein